MKSWAPLVEWLLRGAALLSAATCLVWILGATGTALLSDGPQSLNEAVRAYDLDAAGLSWREVPWWSVAVGLSLLVLAGVWRRGAAMRHDLAGLV